MGIRIVSFPFVCLPCWRFHFKHSRLEAFQRGFVLYGWHVDTFQGLKVVPGAFCEGISPISLAETLLAVIPELLAK
jgi:hypothetical protein